PAPRPRRSSPRTSPFPHGAFTGWPAGPRGRRRCVWWKHDAMAKEAGGTMLESTVHDVALVFEGGGMRNSYSAGAVSVMLEQELFFDDVYGLSAGATNVIDYLSRDAKRAEASFTTCLDGLDFRRWLLPVIGADSFGAVVRGDGLAPRGVRAAVRLRRLPRESGARDAAGHRARHGRHGVLHARRLPHAGCAHGARARLVELPHHHALPASTAMRSTTAASVGEAASWCRARWTTGCGSSSSCARVRADSDGPRVRSASTTCSSGGARSCARR
ncbi:patatin-like phospholipase family protein, partial [Eggerthella sinensis]|uniref:patatin-like phospholipase family protein n=1 Tax=Eggerthella sinensis TaxID=242230 RepID=UPI0022E4A956